MRHLCDRGGGIGARFLFQKLRLKYIEVGLELSSYFLGCLLRELCGDDCLSADSVRLLHVILAKVHVEEHAKRICSARASEFNFVIASSLTDEGLIQALWKIGGDDEKTPLSCADTVNDVK